MITASVMKGLNELWTLQIQITFAFTHSMLIRILHTQFQLRQTELTSIVMFCTIHYCIVNDKFGYKYRKQSTDRLHFRPIPRRTLNRTILFFIVCSFIFLDFFCFFCFFFFWWARHIFIIFVIRKSCYPFPRSNSSASYFLNSLLCHSNSTVFF